MRLVLVCAAVLGLSACATTNSVSQNGLYWGNYSETLYQTKKSPSEATLAKHQAELHSIIDVSAKKGLKVPPGIAAELGRLYARKGDSAMAASFFNKEAQTYPEAQYLMSQLLLEVLPAKESAE